MKTALSIVVFMVCMVVSTVTGYYAETHSSDSYEVRQESSDYQRPAPRFIFPDVVAE